MTSLLMLWEISLLLCMIAAGALCVLVLARVLGERKDRKQEDLRAELLPALLGDDFPAQRLTGTRLDVAATLTSELAEMTRGTEREALLSRADAMGVPELLVRRLHSRSAQTRLVSVETLSLFDDQINETCRALDDRNADVRLGAALALAQRPDAPSPETLVEKLRMGSEEHSLLLVSLMSDLVDRDPGSVAALLFERNIPVEAKIAATDALAQGGGEYAPLLAYMARESFGEPDLQPRIYRALGRNGHPAGADAIAAGLDSPEWTVRAAAAEAAGRIGAAEVSDKLGRMLADEAWWVRLRAGEALLRLGPRGIAALREAAEAADQTVRSTALAMLAEGRAT
ncbi:HEAT repeat domain-containing protein [Qipengyuania sp. 6B39]|uniref:HEAT repeat domain-containing protein n=1 Tax=Qipengyuania proteolytica TaxID=2867239 RepID=UPI001C89080F|nr:HEAT repeat domain-containing protein [Qipengyuania proteolytica]MBX7497010.1 HEAT repeat domain-containing protein [Qipengyuania proteolytica]